jgi:AcrR family transcriptional regulator
MTETATPPVPVAAEKSDKRRAIADAAIRLIARCGLHGAPMSALAREAGVAAGTLYLYFSSKEAMINALYLEVLEERTRAITPAPDAPPPTSAREGLRNFWMPLARWHLDHPDRASLLNQCQASSILTADTRAEEQRRHALGMAQFDDAVAHGALRQMSLQVFWALAVGPVLILSQMRDTGEIEITEELLEATFDGVCRSVLPDSGARV